MSKMKKGVVAVAALIIGVLTFRTVRSRRSKTDDAIDE